MVSMHEMPPVAKAFCTSRAYGALARWVVLPWSLQGQRLSGQALEIGGGSGAMAAQLLRKFPDLQVVATDYDDDMVASARRRLAPFGKRAITQRVDAAALPFADGSFDVVLSFAMLHHVADWERAVAEAVRVLRPGGRLVGYDLVHGPGRLEAALGRLPLADLKTRRSAGGFALRFLATRAYAAASQPREPAG